MEDNTQGKNQTQGTSPNHKGLETTLENEVLAKNNENVDNSEESFVSGIIHRGEAAKLKDGKLPPGVTHEIVEEHDNELPTVQRRRFSSF